jgi:hypothetical protein
MELSRKAALLRRLGSYTAVAFYVSEILFLHLLEGVGR